MDKKWFYRPTDAEYQAALQNCLDQGYPSCDRETLVCVGVKKPDVNFEHAETVSNVLDPHTSDVNLTDYQKQGQQTMKAQLAKARQILIDQGIAIEIVNQFYPE